MIATRNHEVLFQQAPRVAYESVFAEMHALGSSELVHINVDIGVAVNITLHAVEALRRLLPELARTSRLFDPQLIDKLETYALGLFYTDTLVDEVPRDANRNGDLLAEAIKLRALLRHDLRQLICRGHLAPRSLDWLGSGTGYRDLGTDLAQLAIVVEQSWGALQGRSAVTWADIAAAQTLSARLFAAHAERRSGGSVQHQRAMLERRQAYTLFFRAYAELRAAVGYVRREKGDADKLIPSLMAHHHAKRRKKPAAPPPPEPCFAERDTWPGGWAQEPAPGLRGGS